jgi:hypothetical protein
MLQWHSLSTSLLAEKLLGADIILGVGAKPVNKKNQNIFCHGMDTLLGAGSKKELVK